MLFRSKFFGCEDTFYFASGYTGSHIMVSALAAEMDTVLIDEAAHPSLAEGARLAGCRITTFAHHSASDLKHQAQLAGRVLVIGDAVMPATGHVAPVNEYVQVLEERTCAASLLLDDAHGFGVLGERGRGLLEAAGLWERTNTTLIKGKVSIHVCGTLSKALGGFGGLIPGTREFLARVRKSSHYFEAASAPPAAVAAGTSKALEIILQQPALRMRLRENIQRIRNGLRGLGLKVPNGDTAQVGVVTGDTKHMQSLSEALRKRLIFVPHVVAYTGVPPEGILRFAVFATHRPDQIDLLLSELKALL